MMTTSPTLTSDLLQFRIVDWTLDFYSGESGLRIGKRLDEQVLKNTNQPLDVSLLGVESVSPSFINGAFIYLLELYGEDYFRKYIKLKDANTRVAKAIGDSLKGYVAARNEFYKGFTSKGIYLISDGSQEGQSAIESMLLAGSTNINFLVGNSIVSIQRASCAIGVLTKQHDIIRFINEVNLVLQLNKPVLLLLKKHIRFPIPEDVRSKVQIIRYDDTNLVRTLRNINQYVQDRSVRRSEKAKIGSTNIVEVTIWTMLGLGAAFIANNLINNENK